MNKELFFKTLLMLISGIILIINSSYWFLPYSYLLFSERIAILLLIPFSIAMGYLIKIILDKKILNNYLPKSMHFPFQTIFFILIIILSYSNYTHYLTVSNYYSMVTKQDLDAFDWILENTEQDALFLNNYGDAGLWIPAITLRKSRTIQTVPVYFDETEKYLSSLKPNYVYFGEKMVYTKELDYYSYDSQPELYEKVYVNDKVTIFRIK